MNDAQLNKLNDIKNLAYSMYTELRDIEKKAESKSDIDLIKEAIAQGNAVILDTETTGLHDAEVIEIAILEVNTGNVLMNQRIKPHNGIPQESTNVHGITEADVKDCPHFEDVIVEIKGHLAGRDVIVYNATYDRKILHRSAEHAGIDKVNWKSFSHWSCAMLAFSEIYGDWNDYHGNYRWQKLTKAATHYNIEINDAHSALGDCLMTLEVVRAMVAEK